jgi:hypothetical protein
VPPACLQPLLGVVGPGHDLDLGTVVEQRPQAEHDHAVVVDHNDRES